MSKDEKVMVFIDGSNFYYSLQNCIRNVKIDFEKFPRLLARDRKLIRTYYYNTAPTEEGQDPETVKRQQRFYESLNYVNCLELRLGRLEARTEHYFYDGDKLIPINAMSKEYIEQNKDKIIDAPTWIEKGVDVTLAVDMISLARINAYDTAILVSGDGDFQSAMQEVKDMGKWAEIAYFSRDIRGRTYYYGKSEALIKAADRRILLSDKNLESCLR